MEALCCTRYHFINIIFLCHTCIFVGERVIKKHVFGRSGTSRKQPLEGYESYVAICDPVIDQASMKIGLSDVEHRMCIQQMIETTSESSDSSEMEVGPTLTPEEIIHSELQVKFYTPHHGCLTAAKM